MPPRSPRILVDVLAVNPRSRNTLEFAISRHGQGRMDVAQGGDAQLAVVDCDGPQARLELQRYHQRHPDRPLVLLLADVDKGAEYGHDNPGLQARVVGKPVKLDTMIQAIERCAAGEYDLLAPDEEEESTVALPGGFGALLAAERNREERSSATALQRLQRRAGALVAPLAAPDDIDLADPAAVETRRFNAAGYLLDHLRNILAEPEGSETPRTLLLEGRPLLRLAAGAERISLLVPAEELPALTGRQLPAETLALLTETAGDLAPAAVLDFSREALLWRLALLTYQGRIPEDTDPGERVFLGHWPNFTRLDPVPDGLRIAALWQRMPVDLGYTARTLRIPQRHVFLFYAAASAIGLAGPARRASNYLFEPSVIHTITPHTLLSKLADHLHEGTRAAPAEDGTP